MCSGLLGGVPGFLGDVPGFLAGVPGFLGVFRVFECSGIFHDVPVFRCSGVLVFRCSGVPGSTTCRSHVF